LITEPDIFISHISEEAEVAIALKELIEQHFSGPPRVFVSSDGESIKMGRDWLETVLKALRTCKAEIVVCSPKSVARPWVNLEAGAVLVRGVPVIPACHSGMTPAGLPLPLLLRQTARLTEIAGIERICGDLAEALHLGKPELGFAGFVGQIKAFEERYTFWDRCDSAFAVIASAHPKIIPLLRSHSCLDMDLAERSIAAIEGVLPFLRSNQLLDFCRTGRDTCWGPTEPAGLMDDGGICHGCRLLKLPKLDEVLGSAHLRPTPQHSDAAAEALPGWMVRPHAQ
jgi:hypothetical protein